MGFNNVPVNGWPQIKDLEKLDAIAKQIEDMPTFTSNDKAFLADLPAYPDTDGTKVLTATTSSGETSLSYEEPASGAVNYSTTEQPTGQKWIDNKDIYEKTVVIDKSDMSIGSGGAGTYVHGISNIDTCVSVEDISVIYSDGAMVHPYYASQLYNYCVSDFNRTSIGYIFGSDTFSDTSMLGLRFKLKYTKTT